MLSWLLSVATGLLLILIFPRWNLTWVAPFALAPLLVAVAREGRPLRRFLLGWACGIVFWFGVCYWIQFVLSFHGGLGDPLGWAVFMLFCLTKGLHMAFFALLAGILMRRTGKIPLAIPAIAALWVAIEVTHGYLGFAWLTLGNAGIDMSVPLRLAPIMGVYGISFLFAMMSVAIALIALRRPRVELLWLAALPFLTFLPHMPDAHRGQEGALLLQPNISETEEWTTNSVVNEEQVQAEQSRQGAMMGGSRPTEIVVWPEEPAPFYYYQDPQYRDLIDHLAQSIHAYMLFGTVARTPTGAPLNSAVVVSPQGREVTRYDKVNLVPFGEFVPWPFGYIANTISTEAGDFVSGNRIVVSPVGTHYIGTFICYESVFPNFVRKFVRDGADALFTISNDGWFGKSAAREQHLSIVRMRAAENRRWILRSANDGVTAAIDPAGRVVGQLPLYTAGALSTGFNFIWQQTFYTRHGDWFPLLCAVIALAALLEPLLSKGLLSRSRKEAAGEPSVKSS